jgi:hypothetical protein
MGYLLQGGIMMMMPLNLIEIFNTAPLAVSK